MSASLLPFYEAHLHLDYCIAVPQASLSLVCFFLPIALTAAGRLFLKADSHHLTPLVKLPSWRPMESLNSAARHATPAIPGLDFLV
jgi:hypothetical protein